MENVVIVGSGPAGLTAAIYTARANLIPLMIEGAAVGVTVPGGQLMLTSDVENFPGFPKGILGPELMELFKEQALRFGTKIVAGNVERVDFRTRPFRISTGSDEYTARSVIIATGSSAKWIGLESEEKLRGCGVSACATCDGFFFRDKKIAVVGGGDTAVEEATFLTRFASEVAIIHRRDQLRASKIMQEKAQKNPKIRFIWNSVVTEVMDVEKKRVTALRLKDVKTGKESIHSCEGLFVAIGHEPNTSVFKGYLDLDPKDYIVTHDGTKTNVPGVFACGDVQDHVYRQAITAAGSGCMAAIDCERYLEGE